MMEIQSQITHNLPIFLQ